LSVCPNPLDPIDIEALASGETPVLHENAGEHVLECSSCRESVRRSEILMSVLKTEPPAAPVELADRVLRVRPFSSAERRSLSVWSTPLLLLGALSAAGTALVSGVARAGEQVGLAAAFAASAAGLLRATFRWLADLARVAPAGLENLSDSLRPTALGWAALLVLAPLALALRRVLARAFARR
jgi:hypothetical protein